MTSAAMSGWQHIAKSAAPPVIAVVAALVLAQFATFPNLAWHAGLIKPPFNPPNWIFGPVWTTLYVLMAYAAFRIHRLPPSTAQRTALVLFYMQLALNMAWSWMFFYAQSPGLGLFNIVPQVILVVATATAFIRIDRIAGICLLPLVAWVGFATVLNAAIWRLNGG